MELECCTRAQTVVRSSSLLLAIGYVTYIIVVIIITITTKVQTWSSSNFSDISSKFRTVATFVITDLQISPKDAEGLRTGAITTFLIPSFMIH